MWISDPELMCSRICLRIIRQGTGQAKDLKEKEQEQPVNPITSRQGEQKATSWQRKRIKLENVMLPFVIKAPTLQPRYLWYLSNGHDHWSIEKAM